MAVMLPLEGYVLRRGVLTPTEVEALRRVVPSRQTRALLDDARVCALIKDVRARVLDDQWRVVRGLLFDKTPGQNWALGWHRDTSLAVQARHDVPGFGAWTIKDGVTHAIAPREVLQRLISLRVHLDDVDEGNGPLRVKVGSHLRDDGDEHLCLAAAGDVLVFSPLVLHASSSAARPGHRRVVQLECAPMLLPEPLAWRWWV